MKHINEFLSYRFLLLTAIFSMLCMAAGAQKITVKGVVSDAMGPVAGATVKEQGTTNATMTDIDGNYSIFAEPKGALEVSFVGYITQTVPINGQTTIRITLSEDAVLLQEVVAIGYGTVRKNDATGSVTAIKPDEMNKGLVVNAQDALVGKIAGVNVTSDGGTPGGSATIRIRGGSSLSAKNDPLIVIDGLAMDNEGIKGVANPLSMVNPADIETFTVLKDASATAIYGSRASNGVILITTKKGTSGSKPQFSYQGNGSAGILTNRIEVMNASEFQEHITKYFPEKIGLLGTANTDWQDQVYRMAISTDHNLSVSGGLKNMPYRVSLGYTNQNGIIKTSNMNRVTAAINVSPTFFDKHLTVNLNTKGMLINNRYADNGVVGSALAFDPTRPINDDTYPPYGGYYQTPYPTNDEWKDPEWTNLTNTNTPQNPAALLDLKDDRAKSKAFVGNIEADYKIHGLEDLRLHANLGADYSTGKQTTVISPYSYSNNYYGWDGYDITNKYNIQFNAYVQYSKDINDDHHFDIMAGGEEQHFYRDGNSDGAGKYQPTHTESPNEPYGIYTDKWATESFLVSYFGRANWSAYNKYLLTATFRADMSSRFKKDKRTGLFPAFAFAWKMKEENFLKDVNVLSDLKFRLGWGITGQQEINQGDYPALILYKKAQQYADYTLGEKDANGYIYYKPLRPSSYNLDLTWEKTTTYNAGFDFGFLKQRITGTLDFYYRLTNDLISMVDIPVGTNFSNQMVRNIGSLSNTGVELMLNAFAIDNKELKWNIGFNATWNTNKIVSLSTGANSDYYVATGRISSGTGNTIQRHRQGYAAATYWVYETTVTKDGYWEIVNQDGNVDEKGKPIINEKDKIPFHKAAPDFIFGLSSKWQYKNFDLGISLRANIGNYVYNDVLAGRMQPLKTIEREGGFTNVMKYSLPSYAAISGSETITTDNAFFCDKFIENASFLRCDNITLGYSFLIGKKVNTRVYGAVQNPFVITGYTGLDPEINGGIDNNIYPRSMTAILGLSLQF